MFVLWCCKGPPTLLSTRGTFYLQYLMSSLEANVNENSFSFSVFILASVLFPHTASSSQSMAEQHESIDLRSPPVDPSAAAGHSWFPGSPPPIYSCTLTPELVAKAREELQEKPEWRLRDVQALRDMILKVWLFFSFVFYIRIIMNCLIPVYMPVAFTAGQGSLVQILIIMIQYI